MNDLTIQEQFNDYLNLLSKIYLLNNDIDATIDEVERYRYKECRIKYKQELNSVSEQLITLISSKDRKVLVYNHLAKQKTLVLVEDGRLVFEYI